MDFDNRNNQKKHNSHHYSNLDNRKTEGIIPEIIYDNHDDDRDETYSTSKSSFDLNNENIVMDNNSNHNKNEQIENIANDLKPLDVRIIVEGPETSEFLSKAIRNIELFNDFNIIISSIITTTNVEIAKNAVIGSDIILIATSDEDEKTLFSKFFDTLKSDFNYIEFLKFPKLRDIEITDIKNVENEVKNSIIRAALTSISEMANINQLRSEIANVNDELKNSQSINEKVSLENDMLIEEAKHLRKNNNDLNNEIKQLQEHIDEIKLDFTDYKSRYSNIHTRNILEIFPIGELWIEAFDEVLTDDEVEKIVIATNKFIPENVLVGQGYIGAVSKDDAVDWLKIVKTALIFVENDNNELEQALKDYYNKKRSNYSNHNEYNSLDNGNEIYNDNYKEYNNTSNDTSNGVNYTKNDYKKSDDDFPSSNKLKNKSNNQFNDEEDDYNYDVVNQFQNFWD
jgi:predicted nuclease with TOPRIM domain